MHIADFLLVHRKYLTCSLLRKRLSKREVRNKVETHVELRKNNKSRRLLLFLECIVAEILSTG